MAIEVVFRFISGQSSSLVLFSKAGSRQACLLSGSASMFASNAAFISLSENRRRIQWSLLESQNLHSARAFNVAVVSLPQLYWMAVTLGRHTIQSHCHRSLLALSANLATGTGPQQQDPFRILAGETLEPVGMHRDCDSYATLHPARTYFVH